LRDWENVKDIYNIEDRQPIDDIIATYSLDRNPILNRFESNLKFIKDFLESAPYLEELEFAGGEPLLDPLHFKIIDSLPNPGNVILKYNTNLSKINFNKNISISEIWKRFKGIKLTISIDGDPNLNGFIRKNSVWVDILSNLEFVRKELGDNLFEVKVTTCISALNALDLDKTITHIMRDFDAPWMTTRLRYPDFLHANVLSISELANSMQRIKMIDTSKTLWQSSYDKQIQNCLNWLQHCIDHNTHAINYDRYIAFNKALPG